MKKVINVVALFILVSINILTPFSYASNFDDIKENIENKQEESTQEENKQEENKQEESTQEKNKQEENKQEENKQEESTQEKNNQEENKQEESTQEENNQEENKQEESTQEKNNQEENKQEESTQEEHKQEENKQEESTQEEHKQEENKQEESTEEEHKREENKQEENNQEENKQEENKQEENKQEENKQEEKQGENKQEENLSGSALDFLTKNLEKPEDLISQDFTPTASKHQTIYITWTNWTLLQTNNQEWEDLEIYFVSSTWEISHFTIMDRNLWATEPYNQNYDTATINTWSFWYHYQWWNNYGFKPCYALWSNCNTFPWWETTSNGQISSSVWGNYVPSKYANNKLVCTSSWWESSWMGWASTGDNIWWWGWDNDNENWAWTKIDRQWPCPSWYYIPSIVDFWDLIWKRKDSFFMKEKDASQFSTHLLLPPVGYHSTSSAGFMCSPAVYGQWIYGYYWSSSPSSWSYRKASEIYMNENEIDIVESTRESGDALRCFKNTVNENQILHIHMNWWTGAVITFTWDVWYWRIVSLSEPSNSNYSFAGWYKDAEFTELVEKGDIVPSDLYAKFTCRDWLINSWTWCIWYNINFINRWTTVENQFLGVWEKVKKPTDPVLPWYNFLWWYLTGEDSEFNFNSDVVWDIDIYAKYSYKYDFNDLELYFLWDNGDTSHYTIMDRNMWASELYNRQTNAAYMNKNSFWYHYQWWNNYWFASCNSNSCGTFPNWEDTWDMIQYNERSRYIPSRYAKNIWSTADNWMGGSTDDDNIRWWAWDTSDENWSWTKQDRQWPCPDGYYIPSEKDWKNIKNGYVWNYKELSQVLFLPFAWYRGYLWSTSIYISKLWQDWAYWTSSPYNISRAKYFSATDWWVSQRSRSYWHTIRCFKNDNSSNLLNIHGNSGSKAFIAFTWNIWEWKITALSNPIRLWYDFKWWYSDPGFNTPVITWSTVPSDLYAKWDPIDYTVTYNLNWWYRTESWSTYTWDRQLRYTWHYALTTEWRTPSRGDECYENWKVMKCMFDWWYLWTWSYPSRWTWYWSNDITVYAKWLPYTGFIVDFTGFKLTIMDRNLWATASWTWCTDYDTSTCGYHFQFWNNYGFKASLNNSSYFPNREIADYETIDWKKITNWDFTIDNWDNVSSYYNWVYSSSSKFATWFWNSRGGNSSETTDKFKQWPCPEWYHVPDIKEWEKVINLILNKYNLTWNLVIPNRYTNNRVYYSWYIVSKELNLPFAGSRLWNDTLGNRGDRGYYQTTSAYENSNSSIYFYFYSNLSTSSSSWDGIWIGSNYFKDFYSVRCFKDYPIKNLVLNTNWWTVGTYPTKTARWWEDSVQLPTPTKTWLKFLWWYTSPSFDWSTQVTTNAIIDETENNTVTLYAKRSDYYTISFDTNWWSKKQSIQVQWYTPMINAKYSHTSNIDDNWRQHWNYPTNYNTPVNTNDVVTIDWANRLKVKIIYGTYSSSYDRVSMWKWNYPNYTATNNYSTSLTNKLWWWYHTDNSNKKVYYVDWDTVTFSFVGKSYDSWWGDRYWYYAIIEDAEPNYDLWESPTKEWKVFDWWYKENGEKWNEYTDVVDWDITLYAHWKDPEAILLPWKEFNCQLKNLAENSNSTQCYSRSNYSINNIIRADSIPSWVKKAEIQSEDSNYPIYARYKNWTIYIYSEADTIYMNSDSSYMFYYMYSLKNFDADGFDTSKVESMSYMFGYCYAINNLNLNSWNVENVKNTSNMFYYAYGIKDLDLSNWNTNSLENTNNMFYYAQALQNLNLSGWNTDNITNMSNMFYYCTALESLNLNGWDFSNSPNVSSMFNGLNSLKFLSMREWKIPNQLYNWLNSSFSLYNSYALETIDVTNWDLTNTTSLYQLFYQLYSLKEIIWLDTWDTSNIENMYYTFGYLYNVEDLDGVSNWNVSKVTNMYDMFYNCRSIEELDLSRWNTKNVQNMGAMFQECRSLRKINLDNWDFRSVGSMYMFWYGTTNLEDIWMKNWKFSGNVVNFACNMNLWCHWNTPNQIKEIDVSWWTFSWDSLYDLFFNWGSLEKIEWLDTWDVSNIKNMWNMFYGTYNLKDVDFSWWNTSNVTNMYWMFYNASGFSELDLSSFDTSKVENMSQMFRWANNLKTVYASDKFTTTSLLSWDNMFSGATSIVWWNWTIFDSSKINQEYARIDKPWVLWYFTKASNKKYKIDYELNWWIINWEIRMYTIGDSFVLQNPIREWYEFIWWTWSNWLIPEVEVKINSWTKWDLKFTANWKLIPVEPNKSSWWGGWGWGGWGWWTSKSDDKSEDIHGSADEKIIEVEEKGKTFIEREDNKLFAEENKNEIDKVWNKGISQDISEYTQEQVDAYTFAKSNWITTTPTIEKARMNTSLKRIEMAKMLSYYAINVLWQKPDAEKWVIKFNDVTDKMDKQYDNWVTLAYQLWIMWQNMKNNNFRPNDEVTRAEFVTALSRLVYKTDEWKYKWTWKYYEPHMAVLYNEWVITNTDPKLKEKRWYVMLMLMRSMKK